MVGGVQAEMEQFLKTKTWEGVEFLGTIPHARLKDVMSRSHVVVFPSINDGFGMVIGEAMACGCPVISSENCGGKDLIQNGHEGFIVPIRDPAAITERLEQLAQDPGLRQAMGARSLERVTRIGGWDSYGRDYVAVLESLTVPTAREAVA
jgi:glycosyltransferase involved in cell wall biosynthesis